MATTKAGPPRGAGGPKGHSFLPLNSLLAKPDLQDKALAEVSSRYAPVSREGPLPPTLSAQLLKQIYGNALTQLLKSETGQPQAQPQALERLRQRLDDAGFRRRLEQIRLHNQGQRPPSAAFHHQLYHYLKTVGGTQVYWEVIKAAESNAEGMPRLDPVRFREAVQRFFQQQAPVTLIKLGDRVGALALFALAFGLSQPEDAASLIHSLLPHGSGFAGFFGVAPGQEEPPSQEQAPQAQAPQAQATQHQDTSSQALQSDAAVLPAEVPSAATSASTASPEPAAAPLPPEPSAQVIAAPSFPDPLVASTPVVELADDEHWLAIQSCTSVLTKAYEELRTCSEQFALLQEQERALYAANDEDGIAAASAGKLQLIPRRRDAQRRVTEACASLDQQVSRLGATLDKEGADEQSRQLLRRLQELTSQARSSQDAGVARQMHQCAADIRERLRMTRGKVLRELEQHIERVCTQLEELGDSATETRHFLQVRPYLDRTLETAELRLKNELSILQGRLTERRRTAAAESLAALARRLEEGSGSSQEELQEHTKLLETHAAWADREDLSRVGSKLASRISVAHIPFQHAFPLWRRAVRYCWEGASAASRLASVIATLPRAPVSSAEDLAQEIEQMLLDAGFAGDDSAEFWPVLERLVSDGNLAWARGLFLRLWQGAPAPAAQARWWLLYAAPEDIAESRLSELVASLAPAEAYAVRCWAEAKAPSQIRSIPHPLFCAWLDRRTPCPPLQQVREALESAALSKEPAAHALLGVLSVLTQQQSSLFVSVHPVGGPASRGWRS